MKVPFSDEQLSTYWTYYMIRPLLDHIYKPNLLLFDDNGDRYHSQKASFIEDIVFYEKKWSVPQTFKDLYAAYIDMLGEDFKQSRRQIIYIYIQMEMEIQTYMCLCMLSR